MTYFHLHLCFIAWGLRSTHACLLHDYIRLNVSEIWYLPKQNPNRWSGSALTVLVCYLATIKIEEYTFLGGGLFAFLFVVGSFHETMPG